MSKIAGDEVGGTGEEVQMQFRRPQSSVVSVRVNARESRILTAAARARHEKLSTFIKRAALDAAGSLSEPKPGFNIGQVNNYFVRTPGPDVFSAGAGPSEVKHSLVDYDVRATA